MSASPPPPPPPFESSPPIAPAPVLDRHTLREQRRAANVAARHQRTMQRLQRRAMRRNSILGPVLLVAIGIFFLLVQLGDIHPDKAFVWMAHWWPLLLLGAGLVLLGEWAVDTWTAGQRQSAIPRRTLGTGGVILLGLVTLAGLLAMATYNSSNWVRQNWNGELGDTWNLDQFFAQHSETEQELTAPLGSGALLTVQNYRGSINITGASPDNQVHVSIHQRLAAWRREELQARTRQDQPQLKNNGSGLLLLVPGADLDRADLTIEVPHGSALEISPEKGDISVSEVRGPVTIGDHTGNIALTGLTGHVAVTARDENATITGHSLSGDLTLQGRSGDLAFSDITGPLTLHGDFFGTTHLERIKGPMHFQSSFTDLACAGIPGELTIEGRNELEAENLDGPVVLSTSNRNVSLSNVRHGLTLHNRNGSVTLALAEPLGPAQVSNADGSIELSVPDSAAFALVAETADGQLNNDLGLTSSQQDHRSSITGQVHKGGPTLSLKTTEGDITIHKLSEAVKDDKAAQLSDQNDEEDTDSSGSSHRLRRLRGNE